MFVLPFSASAASFNTDLQYGSTGTQVTQLQEFLTDQGVYSGPITGNFFSLTLAGVKAFQRGESVQPVSGYFGPITRGVANDILSKQAPDTEGSAATTTPAVDLHTNTTPVQQTTCRQVYYGMFNGYPMYMPQCNEAPVQSVSTPTQMTNTQTAPAPTPGEEAPAPLITDYSLELVCRGRLGESNDSVLVKVTTSEDAIVSFTTNDLLYKSSVAAEDHEFTVKTPVNWHSFSLYASGSTKTDSKTGNLPSYGDQPFCQS